MREAKICLRCKKLLDFSEFSLKSKNSNATQSWCRECFSRYNANRRGAIIEHSFKPRLCLSEEDRRKRKSMQTMEHRRRNSEHYKKYLIEYRLKNLDKIKEIEKRRKRGKRKNVKPKRYDALKNKARSAVNNAVRRGDVLKGACEVCGSLNVQAHHDDYNKPLQVRWLCVLHHIALHKSLMSE